MRRRRSRPASTASHERWLVSYADFITLLFAFFVVLFAVSQVDRGRVGRFTESLRAATEYSVFESQSEAGTGRATPIVAGAGEAASRSDPDAMARLRDRLRRTLADGVGNGRIELTEVPEGLVIRFRDAAYFEAGSAAIQQSFASDMTTVADALNEGSESLRIEGHTDPRPIRNSVYRTNWDLSAARAASVLALFAAHGVVVARMSVAGYADQRPVAENDTDDGRRHNRRVDVVVLREAGTPSPDGPLPSSPTEQP